MARQTGLRQVSLSPPFGAPSGLIAMLFTDIEGSTRLAASLGDEWTGVLAAYHEIVGESARSAGGWIDGTAGDGFFVTFADVAVAGRVAVETQLALGRHSWPAGGEVRVRMGLHVGQVQRRSHGYVGLEIHRAARVGAAAHGGQLLLTGAAAELLRGVVPSQPLGAHRLKDFPAPTALYCAVIDGRGAAAFPPPRTLELRAGNLPAASVSLIGREADLFRVRAALRQEGERLVTLLGRGGMGKTSLALAVAHDLLGDYESGVWWIDASRAGDSTDLLEAIATNCRIDATGPTREAVIADLGSRDGLLLVVDNLEQVAGAGELLEMLLERLPDLTVLVTSQLPLHCRPERQLQVGRLEEADAHRLLVRAAERLDIPPAHDRDATLELIRALDGLPLAIELAAGRLRLFPPAELLARLRQSTSILEDRARPDRQRSLSAALDWTLGLLDSDAFELFTRLGVFAGPVELEDIERVLGADGLDVITAVAVLLDAALLQRIEIGDGFVRFGFPEAIRQEASRRLDASGTNTWRRAHAVWQHERVWPLRIYEIAEPRQVEQAHGTLAETRSALVWSWENDRPLAREMALGLFSLAHRAGAIQEGRELIERLTADRGDAPQVVDLVREHVALLGRTNLAEPVEGSEPLRELFTELSDPYARFLCAQNCGISLTWEKRFDEALSWLEQARSLAHAISPRAEASQLVIIADTLLEADQPDAAAAALAEADALADPNPSSRPLAIEAEAVRATLESRRGAHADALNRHAHALTAAELAGDNNAEWILVLSLVRVFARAGREHPTLETAGIAQAITDERAAQGDFVSGAFAEADPAVTDLIARLGPVGQEIIERGRALEPAQRVKRLCALIYAT
jgi:class 3 adenylate cyclase/predicted ATPase